MLFTQKQQFFLDYAAAHRVSVHKLYSILGCERCFFKIFVGHGSK